MQERKLATVRQIVEVKPIQGADNICAYRVDGWWVVDQIGKYKAGDKVVYCEVDSWIPHTFAPFLSKGKEPRIFEGVYGERLRTIRLKGQISQGLFLSCNQNTEVGTDLTDSFCIIKYEKPLPAQLSGVARGNFPSDIPKTNQERIQNLSEYLKELQEHTYTVTEKLDGTSCTFYLDAEGKFHVCSRNLDLLETEDNLYWKMARELDIEAKMRENSFEGIALQGEIIGEGIQGNQYKCKPTFCLFDVYDTGEEHYQSQYVVQDVAEELGLNTVPVLVEKYNLKDILNDTIENLLFLAEGKSQLNDSQREGLVFQSNKDPSISFKVISNTWLLKNE